MTNYRTTQPQNVSGWGGNQIITYAGKCANCGRNVYRIDGADPDPRGHIDENHACRTLVASEYEKHGPDIIICWNCGNTRAMYDAAMSHAKEFWADSLTCDGGEDSERPCYRLDLGAGGGIFLCRTHWAREMNFRMQRNQELDPENQFDILPWPGKGWTAQ